MDNEETQEPEKERLVFRVNGFSCTQVSFREFVRCLDQYKVTEKVIQFEELGDGSYIFYVEIPEQKKPEPRPGQPKKITVPKSVARQIEARRQAVQSGEEVPGYVPPVKRKIKVVKKK